MSGVSESRYVSSRWRAADGDGMTHEPVEGAGEQGFMSVVVVRYGWGVQGWADVNSNGSTPERWVFRSRILMNGQTSASMAIAPVGKAVEVMRINSMSRVV